MEQQNQEDQESNPQQPLTPPSLGQNQVDPALIDPQLFAEPTPAGPILTLQRSVLRPYYEGDIDDVVAEANNHRVARWQPESFHHPFTREDAESFVREYTPSEGDPIEQLAICRLDTNVLIGGIGVVPCTWEHRRTFEIGYWLGESHWGQGIMTEALVAFSKWAFDNFEKLLRLQAEVYEPNVASARVLEKAGYVRESVMRQYVEKDGVVLNSLIYVMLRE